MISAKNRWLALPWLVAIPAALISAWLAGSLVAGQLPGIANAPVAVQVLLPVARVCADLAGITTVGFLLVAAFLLPNTSGLLDQENRQLARTAALAAVLWLASTAAAAVFTLSDIFAVPVSALTNPTALFSFLTQISIGQIFLVQLVIALIVIIAAPLMRRPWQAAVLVGVALIGMGARGAAGHGGIGSDHETATMLLSFHIAAVSLWVGGLIAIGVVIVRGQANELRTVRRFSALALWCVIAVAVTGLVQVSVRLSAFSDLFTTTYGILLIIKVELLALLIAIGWFQRARSLPLLEKGHRAPLIRLAVVEVTVMALVLGISVTLSQTAAVGLGEHDSSAHGHDLPPIPQSPWQFITQWHIDVIVLTMAVVLAGGYLAARAAIRQNGSTWPAKRTFSFLLGMALLFLVSVTGIGSYAPVLLADEMPRSFALLLLIPTLLIAGRPDSLLLKALPKSTSGEHRRHQFMSIRKVLIYKVSKYPEIPLVAMVTLIVVMYGTRMMPMLMTNFWWRIWIDLITLAVGLWACAVILSAVRKRTVRKFLPLIVTFITLTTLLILTLPSIRLITPGYFAGFSPQYVDNVYTAQRDAVLISMATLCVWITLSARLTKKHPR